MKIIAITGEKRTGKSSLINNIFVELNKKSLNIDGFLSLPVIVNDKHNGFDLFQIKPNLTIPLARVGIESSIQTANFGFYVDAFDYQHKIINSEKKLNTILLLDEIGILELRDLGWHSLVLDIRSKAYKSVILVIRKNAFFEITKKYNLKYDFIVDLDTTDISLDMLSQRIINFLI
jgi:nucleoside-triphosphatase THEP1